MLVQAWSQIVESKEFRLVASELVPRSQISGSVMMPSPHTGVELSGHPYTSISMTAIPISSLSPSWPAMMRASIGSLMKAPPGTSYTNSPTLGGLE